MDIINSMLKVCKENGKNENSFDTLKKLYDHISQHNEPMSHLQHSIKDIIDKETKWDEE